MDIEQLLSEIRMCRHCEDHLPLGPNPVLNAASKASILIVGQAPGKKVHDTGIPWNDPSGDRLRRWMEMDREEFYDAGRIAILPMGFCYPGKGISGDMPPRPECAALWREKLHECLPGIKLTLLTGTYAQAYYLQDKRKASLTETVRAFEEYLPLGYLPLVHPSPRNQAWYKKNPWFEEDIVPVLRLVLRRILHPGR